VGETIARIKVSSLKNLQSKEMDALVDTGATYTTLPGDILLALGVEYVDRISLKLADSRVIERRVGNVVVEIEGKIRATPVIFGEAGDATIVGLVTLEACGLTVDTINKKLIPLPEIHHY